MNVVASSIANAGMHIHATMETVFGSTVRARRVVQPIKTAVAIKAAGVSKPAKPNTPKAGGPSKSAKSIRYTKSSGSLETREDCCQGRHLNESGGSQEEMNGHACLRNSVSDHT